jgi:hypothetical protein
MTGKKGLKVVLMAAIIVAVVFGVSIFMLVKYANRIIKGELERRLGKAFSIERIDLKWGHVEATGIKLKDKDGKEVARVESLSARADFMQFLRKEYVISSLTIKSPYLFVEVDHKGALVSPILPVEGKPTVPATKKETPKTAPAPLTITHLRIEDGAIDYLDGKPHAPALTKVREISLDARDIRVPFPDGFTRYDLSARIPGNRGAGSVKSNGKIGLKTMDMECVGEVRGLDITNFKPYFQKDADVNITRGFLDVDLHIKVESRKLYAPGKAVLKDVEFTSLPGAKNRFMGVPLSLVVLFLKRSGDQIPVNFTLQGDLDNPKVNIRENFVNSLSQGIASKLGLSLMGMGQSMVTVGSAGAKGVGSGVKGIGNGLKRVFSK